LSLSNTKRASLALSVLNSFLKFLLVHADNNSHKVNTVFILIIYLLNFHV